MLFFLFLLLCSIGIRVGTYKIFEKRGIAGWKAFVPFLCSMEWQKLIDKPSWWTYMLLLPGVNLFYWAGQLTRMSTAHGRSSFLDHTLAVLAAPIYWIWLGFTDKIIYISPTGLKPGEKAKPKSTPREWADALIFALAAAYLLRMFVFEAYTIPTPSMEKTLLVGDFLFVSKFHYGARVPQTPIAFPLLHHSLPNSTIQSYSEIIKLPYMKLPAIQKVKRFDMVVFNFPAGDTVALEKQEMSYYDLLRIADYQLKQSGNASITAYDAVRQQYHIKDRPVDKRENYIKRCVAVPGDKLEVKEGNLYINDQPAYEPENIYLPYNVSLDANVNLTQQILDELDIDDITDRFGAVPPDHKVLLMTRATVDKFKTFSGIKAISPFSYPRNQNDDVIASIFPNNFKYYHWNVDNFGPVTIPRKGMKLTLNDSTINQYTRLIQVYEGNQLEERDGKIFINGKATTEYTCKLDYYWMMGDNRHNSQDSRYWGFVPEDHIVGKAWFIWLSINYKAEDFLHKIRWSRLFTSIHGKYAPK